MKIIINLFAISLLSSLLTQEDELTIYNITDEEFEEHIAPHLPEPPDPALVERMQLVVNKEYEEGETSCSVQSAIVLDSPIFRLFSRICG